jgi:hypothetical protein
MMRDFRVAFGAFLALLAVAALAVIAQLSGVTAIHDVVRDVGRNTGPLAFFGGLGAWLSAFASGGSGPPPTWHGRGPSTNPWYRRDGWDPVSKTPTYRWETPSERFGHALSDGLDRVATAIVGEEPKGSSGNAGGKA